MISPDSEDENRSQPSTPSVREFLNQGIVRVGEAISSFPEGATGLSLDERMALKLIDVGRNHLRSLHDQYGSIVEVPNPQDAQESLVGVTFGVAYMVLEEFLNTQPSEEEYMYDNNRFLSQFDRVLKGTFDHTEVKTDTHPARYEKFDQATWNDLRNAKNEHGPRIFGSYVTNVLPHGMEEFIQSIDQEKTIHQLAERVTVFLKSLELLKDTDDTDEPTVISFTELRPQQSPGQKKRDEGLRDLLSGIPGFPTIVRRYSNSEQRSDDPRPTDASAAWNNRQWLNNLLKDVDM